MCHVGSLCRGPKYSLLAHTSLTLQHVQEAFKSHDLSVAATGYSSTSLAFLRALPSPPIRSPYLCLAFPEEDAFWLPLYGNMCCRLVAQPLCMVQPLISGRLQVTVPRLCFMASCQHGVMF